MKLLRILIPLLALSYPAAALAQQPAGRVLLAVGEVSAERAGQTLRLALNAPVYEGDTLRLGPASNAQVRLTDQSVVALRERTVFRIEEYRYEGGEEGRGFFSLLAGGMRTVTGAIGRAAGQRGNYAVKTPTSTIGIRGTHYTLVHCNNDCGPASSASALLARAGGQTVSDAGLQLAQAGGPAVANGTYGGVTDGRISASPNEAPQLGREFGHDEYFFVANASSAPQSLIAPPSILHDRLSGQQRTQGQKGGESSETLAQSGIDTESRPNSVPAGPKPSDFIVTEQKTSTGQSAVVASTPTHGGVVAFRGGDGSRTAGGAFFLPSNVTLTGSGGSQTVASINLPVGTTTTDNPIAAPGFTATSSGTIQDIFVGSTAGILLGRWTGGTAVDDTGTSSLPGGLHFVYGPLTPPDTIAAKTGSFTFNSVASTTPTHSAGLTFGGGGMPGSLTVNFTNRTVGIPSMSFTFGAQTWSLPSLNGAIKIVSGVGASFNFDSQSVGSCGGGGCSGTLSVEIGGIFMGPASSQHLGVSLGAGNNLFQTIQGAKLYFCSGC